MGKDKKSSSTIVTILQIALPVLGTIAVAYFGYLGLKLQVETPIHATQTAEAKLTAIAQVFAITPAGTLPDSTPPIEVNANLEPTETPSTYAEPIEFVRNYFSLLNNRQYQEAWAKLSNKYKENLDKSGGGYNEYVSFWNTVDKVELSLIEIKSQSNSEVYVYTEILYYYKEGYTTTGHTTYKLVKDSSKTSWLFDPN